MLDVRAVVLTPGSGLTLGGTDAIAANDGAQVAGVPLRPDASLRMWGAMSPTANTLATVKLQSQDMVDPINGVTVAPGTTSLLNQWFDYTTLPYKTGARIITAGTNTGQSASLGILIDEYPGGPVVKASRSMGGDVVTGTTTFSGALTANAWGVQAYAPTTAIPNGKYALLGAEVHAISNVAAIRFSHADFGFVKPGFFVSNSTVISSTSWDKVMKDDLVLNSVCEQFIYLSDIMGKPEAPVFTVSNAGTGLNIEMISVQADTPIVTLFLVKVG